MPAQPVCQSQPGGYAYEFVAFNSEDAVSRPERCSRETIAFCGAAAEGIREGRVGCSPESSKNRERGSCSPSFMGGHGRSTVISL